MNTSEKSDVFFVGQLGQEQVTEAEFEGNSQYCAPFCYELGGKFFDLVLDNGREIFVQFLDGQNLAISEKNITEHHYYECLKCRENIYLVHLEKKGRWPREGLTIVLDLDQSLVTVNFLTQGAVKEYEKLVVRDLQFGAIRLPGKSLPLIRHAYTRDLIGEKIEYTYSPDFSIIHIYQDGKCRAANPEIMRKKGLSAVPTDIQFEEPCIYIKITENVYVFSWIEENFGSGTQGFMLMDTWRTNDVGLFFGVNPQGNPESYMITAIGRYVTETLPEETAPSNFY